MSSNMLKWVYMFSDGIKTLFFQKVYSFCWGNKIHKIIRVNPNHMEEIFPTCFIEFRAENYNKKSYDGHRPSIAPSTKTTNLNWTACGNCNVDS